MQKVKVHLITVHLDGSKNLAWLVRNLMIRQGQVDKDMLQVMEVNQAKSIQRVSGDSTVNK